MTATIATPTGLYERVAALPVHINAYALTPLELRLNEDYTRLTTIVHLHGDDAEGLGEDTTYAPPDQLAFRATGASLPLAGDWTIASFSAHLARLELFSSAPSHPDFRYFRRWAFESAALDLALQQAGLSLAEALGCTAKPLTFVASPGPENTAAPVLERLARQPGLRLKLMVTPEWDDALVEELAATGAIDVVDLKGQYDKSVPVAVAPDPALYARVLRAFRHAWIEDPGVTQATEDLLRPHMDRVTWDARIRSATDIARCVTPPRMINIKPSRFGSVRALLETYDYCARVGIGMYGGGQFELGPGRAQIQQLASLMHPDGPNDVAPTAFNEPSPPAHLPSSPLPVPARRHGFR